MNDNRSKRMRKRLGAGILAVFMAFTSIQVPSGTVYAEEMAAVTDKPTGIEGAAGVSEQPRQEGDLPETGTGNPGSGEAVNDEDRAEPGEDGSDTDNGGEETPEEVSGEEPEIGRASCRERV